MRLGADFYFIGSEFSYVDHASVKNEVLTFDALQSASNNRVFIEIMRGDLSWVLLHRIAKVGNAFAQYFNCIFTEFLFYLSNLIFDQRQ